MATSVQQPMSTVHITPKRDESRPMKAVEWHGKRNIQVKSRPKPMVTDPTDVILKVTSTAICGSDLHLYLNAMPGMQKGDVVGHEFMGIVDDVGTEVQNIKRGDRVVASFDMACGKCLYCRNKAFTSCDITNPSKEQEALYGHRTSGMFGYSHLTGGWDGGQAEYARVPFGDVNLLKIDSNLPDTRVLFLSDILPTAWHANELGMVGEGDNVAIWGAGPVGILAAHCALYRGANHVYLIDNVAYRLEHAQLKLGASNKLTTIDFSKKSTVDQLKEVAGPHGVDVGIEAVGFHYAKSITHKVEMAIMAETDPSEILNEIITCTRKAGRIGIVGVYAGYCNHFNIGAFMEKGLSMRAGQTPVQKYWHTLMDLVSSGKLDPSIVITHELPLEEAPHAYAIFNDKQDNCVKVVLHPAPAA